MRGSVKNKIYEVKLCKCGCGRKVKWNKLFRRLNDYIIDHIEEIKIKVEL